MRVQVFFTAVPLLVSTATFFLYVSLGNTLTAAEAFTAISLFNILRFPLAMLPNVINNLVEARVSLKRIQVRTGVWGVFLLLSCTHFPKQSPANPLRARLCCRETCDFQMAELYLLCLVANVVAERAAPLPLCVSRAGFPGGRGPGPDGSDEAADARGQGRARRCLLRQRHLLLGTRCLLRRRCVTWPVAGNSCLVRSEAK